MDPAELMPVPLGNEPESNVAQVEVVASASTTTVHTQLSDVDDDVDDPVAQAHKHSDDVVHIVDGVHTVDIDTTGAAGDHHDVDGDDHGDGDHGHHDPNAAHAIPDPSSVDDHHDSEEASGMDDGGPTRRRSGSTTSRNGGGSGSSVGRLRVNDKGEPLNMTLPSFIWDYFIKEANGKFVVCTLCPNNVTRFAYSGGTSTMNRHLRKRHQKFAPGKTAADYEYPKAAKRALAAALASSSGHSLAGTGVSAVNVALATSPASSSSGSNPLHHSHAAVIHAAVQNATAQDLTTSSGLSMGSLSPSEATRRQLIDLRNARRRATTNKRRKLLHGMLDGSDQYTTAPATATVTSAPPPPAPAPPTEFDPSAFVTIHTPGSVGVVGGLQFPPGFELTDATTIDAATVAAAAAASGTAGDVRLLDYTPTPLVANPLLAHTPSAMTPLYVPRANPSRRNPQQQKLLTHRLLKYLIAQYEPLDVTRMGAELGALVNGSDLFYPGHMNGHDTAKLLPSEETLKLALANLYYSQREMLKEVIAEVDMLSLSLNNWKSVFGQNVLTVSGHWISQGFSRRDCVLEVYVLPLDESVNTIALLRDVMDKWDIPANKVAALTMLKNGKGEEKAIHEEYPGLTVVNCFVSVLDNAVSAGLVKCAPLIRRCRNYVSYFIQNPSEYQIFLSLQRRVAESNLGLHDVNVNGDDDPDKNNGESPKAGDTGPNGSSASSNNGTVNSTSSPPLTLPALSVICDFEDRWNSTSEMICRIVELEQMLMVYKSNLESDTNPNRRPMQLRFVCCELSSDEWANLKELARLLEPIEGVVHVATNCEYPGLSIILPLIHSIQKHLDHAELWVSTSLVSTVRNAIASALTSALPLTSCGAMPPSTPYMSCLLDPRFKALPFLESHQREELVEMLKVLHLETADDDGHGADKDTSNDHLEKKSKPNSHASKKGGLLLNTFFPMGSETSHHLDPTSEIDRAKAHVQLYLDSPSLPPTDDRENDPLDWWSRYVRSFPGLAKLAKKYLCMSAVSVPFYEAFTNYGQLMREKKARLDIEVAAQILFCRSVSRIPEMERMNV